MSFPINIPSAFSQELVRELRDKIEDIVPRGMPDEQMNSSDMAKTIAQMEGGSAHVIRILEMFCEAGCVDLAKQIFNDDIVFLLPQCAYRFHEPARFHSHLPFHVDAGFLGIDATTLTFWVPLVDVGDTAPSLTFLRPDLDQVVFLKFWADRARIGDVPYLEVGEIEQLYGKPQADLFTTPVLPAGSVSIFHHLTPHAIQSLTDGGAYRVSLDYRIAARSALPQRYTTRDLPVATVERAGDDWRVALTSAGQLAS